METRGEDSRSRVHRRQTYIPYEIKLRRVKSKGWLIASCQKESTRLSQTYRIPSSLFRKMKIYAKSFICQLLISNVLFHCHFCISNQHLGTGMQQRTIVLSKWEFCFRHFALIYIKLELTNIIFCADVDYLLCFDSESLSQKTINN